MFAQAKLKEAEDAAEELRVKLDGVMREKAALEAQLLEFTQTLAQRDELIAQLRTGREVRHCHVALQSLKVVRFHIVVARFGWARGVASVNQTSCRSLPDSMHACMCGGPVSSKRSAPASVPMGRSALAQSHGFPAVSAWKEMSQDGTGF